MTTKIEELLLRKNRLLVGGGEEKIKKHKEKGKLTARERLDYLFDQDTFFEIDTFVNTRSVDFKMDQKKTDGDGVITGAGMIHGRLCYVSSQDFTVMGGSLGEMHAKKITKVMDMALKAGAPFVSINDSGGARIEEGIDALGGFGDIFYRNTKASGVIPQISVIMGPCAGGAVYSPAITDFVFMVENTSQMFITGPGVIKTVTGEEVSFEQLGGANTHNAVSGVAHFKSPSDEACLDHIRELFKFLPDNNLSGPPLGEYNEQDQKSNEELDHIIPSDPNKSYDILQVIRNIVDGGDFFEVQQHFAPNIVIGFARMGGQTVGIIANQPKFLAGVLDVNSSDKAARFIRFCDAFNYPLVTFTDVPGYLPGVSQEHSGVIRHGAKLLYAFSEATVPKINVILRKAYGGAYIAMNSRHLGADFVFAWPSAEIAVMGPEGAANIIFKKEIQESADQELVRLEKISEYKEKFSHPYIAAARGFVDDVILPAETKFKIIGALNLIASKREVRPPKKHGNIPL